MKLKLYREEMDKEVLRAVHEQDLDEFLQNLGILERFNNGAFRCPICESSVTRENIGTVYSSGGKINICCNKPACLMKVFSSRHG